MKTKNIISWGAFALTLVALPSLDVQAQVAEDTSEDRPQFEQREGRRSGWSVKGRRGFGKRQNMTAEQRAEKKAAFEALSDEEKESKRAEGKERKGKGHEKGRKGFRAGHGKQFGKNVETSTQILENGVSMTLTTDDAETLQKLFDRADKMIENEKEGTSVVKLSNGITVTKTSEDSEKVGKIQKKAQKIAFRKSTTRTFEKVENGIAMTVTSTNAEAVEKIQSREARNHRNDIVVQKELLSNGIKIIHTSTDSEVVSKMHERIDKYNEFKAQQ